MPDVYLSLGSNIRPEIHIPAALEDLRELFGPLRLSSIYETAAVGFEGPPFHNLIAVFHSDRDAQEIARLLRHIEDRHGRSRTSQKFSSRTLDVDLILYGDAILDENNLHLPRDEITKFAFVLEPLAEIAADLRHPVIGKTYRELWAAFDNPMPGKKLGQPSLVK
jgi:2-amino-4-hydroxy-6-hydroxymethyldihydropteridine diphosphokinase